MSQIANHAQIGDAWSLHRAGNNSEAIRAFQDALKMAADDVDIYYGLGLAQRANKQYDQALESFQTALNLAKQKLDQLRAESHQENQLSTTNDDRYMMLTRMIGQRIEEAKRLKG